MTHETQRKQPRWRGSRALVGVVLFAATATIARSAEIAPIMRPARKALVFNFAVKGRPSRLAPPLLHSSDMSLSDAIARRRAPSGQRGSRRTGSPLLALPGSVEVRVRGEPFEIRIQRPGRGWRAIEDELDAAGVPLPLSYRHDWVVRRRGPDHRLFSAHSPDGRCRAMAAVELTKTRAAPGHVVARGERLGPAVDPEALAAVTVGIGQILTPLSRVLRVEVASKSLDPKTRAAVAAHLRPLGFRRSPEARDYERTIVVDLDGDEEALLAHFHHTARRHIRAIDKRPVRLGVIDDPALVEPMNALVAETRRRTHGPMPVTSLASMVDLARARPDLVRIVGVFSEADGELLAFATGDWQGDHASYAEAASTRHSRLHLALGYAPLWELMRWAKTQGAEHFDLGGITGGSFHDDEDPLGGISDFKRLFRGRELLVGEEWVAEPRALRAAIATQVSRAARWARATLRDLL